MKETSKSFIYIAIVIASWSTVATAFKLSLQHYSNYELILVAAITAVLAFAVVISFQRKWHLLKTITSKDWKTLAITGLLSPTGYYLVLFKAYDLLPAQIASSINYSWPIILTVLLAIVFKQRIQSLKYLGMAISLAGVSAISFASQAYEGEITGIGLPLAFLSAFMWATFWIISRKSDHIDNVLKLFIIFSFGLAYLLIGTLFVDVDLRFESELMYAAYVGLFEMAIPFVFFGLALKKTDNPALINQLCFLSPFISLFIINAVLGEKILFGTIIGLTLIISGIIFNEYAVKRINKKTL